MPMRIGFLVLVATFAACSRHTDPNPDAVLHITHQFSRDAMLQRVTNPTHTPQLIEHFVAASQRALSRQPDRAELAAIVSQFNPLWDSTGHVIPSAVDRYRRRVATVPRAAARRWASVSGLNDLSALFSLAAFGGLWYNETFSQPAFTRLVARAQAP